LRTGATGSRPDISSGTTTLRVMLPAQIGDLRWMTTAAPPLVDREATEARLVVRPIAHAAGTSRDSRCTSARGRT